LDGANRFLFLRDVAVVLLDFALHNVRAGVVGFRAFEHFLLGAVFVNFILVIFDVALPLLFFFITRGLFVLLLLFLRFMRVRAWRGRALSLGAVSTLRLGISLGRGGSMFDAGCTSPQPVRAIGLRSRQNKQPSCCRNAPSFSMEFILQAGGEA
jgi:hypothetical protein